tara:strand:+ start:13208 stop:13396 length:189 start_codon:yes stop_codon:yes gene_type:complete
VSSDDEQWEERSRVKILARHARAGLELGERRKERCRRSMDIPLDVRTSAVVEEIAALSQVKR